MGSARAMPTLSMVAGWAGRKVNCAPTSGSRTALVAGLPSTIRMNLRERFSTNPLPLLYSGSGAR